MIGPYLINKRATLWEFDVVVWIANWRWNNTIEICRQKRRLTRSANNPRRLRGSAWVSNQQLDTIKDKRLRSEEGCARRVKHVSRHIIAVRPYANLRIIKEVAGQMEVVPIPCARGVASLGYCDAFVLGHTGASWCGELADNPSVGELIVHHYRIAIAAILARTAEARPN